MAHIDISPETENTTMTIAIGVGAVFVLGMILYAFGAFGPTTYTTARPNGGSVTTTSPNTVQTPATPPAH